MSNITIKADGTIYRHRRTDDLYRARHVGLVKIGGAHGPREGWVESVFYQSVDRPSLWFAREKEFFVQSFIEEREHQITHALLALGLNGDLPRAKIDAWFQGKWHGNPVLFGDIIEHASPTKVGQDARTSTLRYVDTVNKFAISQNTIYELLGEEVQVLSTRG